MRERSTGDTLGLKLVSEDPFALVFDAGHDVLRVQKVQSFTPHPFTARRLERARHHRRGARARREGRDASSATASSSRTTTACGRHPMDGRRVVQGPDGNTLSLAQVRERT
jgi:hypothetical protein